MTGETGGHFELNLPPRVVFGPGEIKQLGPLVAGHGKRLLLVTGGKHFADSGLAEKVLADLGTAGVETVVLPATAEPDVDAVDAAARKGRLERIDVVAGIGGGSVIDLAKAVAGMIPNEGSIMEYLEGVGSGKAMSNAPLPLVAAPTTAGTGSEATKNAVIRGEGFKRSLRDPRLVPRAAIVDPELTVSCPPGLTAEAGMDAVTQLIESLTSLKASPVTGALALSGLEAAGRALSRAVAAGRDLKARSDMAYASFSSGVALAHAGLGAVHGLAAALGGFFPVPHSVACARLLPIAAAANIAALEAGRGYQPALLAYRDAAKALGEGIREFCGRFRMPGPSEYGMTAADIPRVVAASRGGSMKTNPVELSDGELAAILREAL